MLLELQLCVHRIRRAWACLVKGEPELLACQQLCETQQSTIQKLETGLAQQQERNSRLKISLQQYRRDLAGWAATHSSDYPARRLKELDQETAAC